MGQLIFINNKHTGPAKEEKLDGEDYLVVNAVLIKEDVVMNNIKYTRDSIVSSEREWNNRPITIPHPYTERVNIANNETVKVAALAKTPKMIDKFEAGRIFNARIEGKKLLADMWININKATNKGYGEVVEHIRNGGSIDISTGLVANVRDERGVLNGREYEVVAESIYPDHVAILPDEVGACSVADGCGIAVQNNCGCGGPCCQEPTVVAEINTKEVETMEVENKDENKDAEIAVATHNEETKEAPTKEVEAKNEEATVEAKDESLETVLNSIKDSRLKECITNALDQLESEKNELVEAINKDSEFTKNELLAFNNKTLKKINALIKKESKGNYSGQVGVLNSSAKEVYEAPSLVEYIQNKAKGVK